MNRVEKRESVKGILTTRKSKQLSSLARLNGYTVRQDRYMERVVFGGEYRTTKDWAKLFKVTPQTVQKWNSDPRIQTHLRELEAQRKQQMQLAFGQKLEDVVMCLLDVMHASPEYADVKGQGKNRIKVLRLDPQLQRTRIEAARELATIIGARPSDGEKGGVQISQTFASLHQTNAELTALEQDENGRAPAPEPVAQPQHERQGVLL